MIDIINQPLSHYLRMIRENVPFSFSRYWDGEIACMIGRQGANCDGCRYTEELRFALCRTITNNYDYYHALNFPYTHMGTVNLRKQFEDYLHDVNNNMKWYDANVFQRAFETNSFHDVIKALSGKDVIFAGGNHLSKIQDRIPIRDFIETPERDAFTKHIDIELKISEKVLNINNPVVIMCAGMASNVIIDNLFPIIGVKVTMIDMGSVWDAFLGLQTRQWIRRLKNGG